MARPLPDWLSDPALDQLFTRVRERLERSGLAPVGRLRVGLPTRQERHAASALLGRTVTRDVVTLDLEDLDQRLRARSGVGGLLEVVILRSGPLRDRPAERRAARTQREEPLALALELVDEPWGEVWVAGLRRSGLLSRSLDAEAVVRQAVQVVQALRNGAVPGSRVELAAHVVGDAHALDEDRVLSRVVLRAIAAIQDAPVPETLEDRWGLWDRFGVSPDTVSSSCLVLGITGTGGAGSLAGRLRLAREGGDPVHLTRWDLRRLGGFDPPGSPVLVCENPRVLEAVAETYGGAVSVVCTSGEPNTVVTAVLARVLEAGGVLRYHGDFDWPGIAIANRMVARFDAQPWRMRAGDYERGVRADAPELSGTPVDASWDPELGPAMRARGRSLHEETVLGWLLDALAR